MAFLLLYDTDELDFARDVKELLASLGVQDVEMIPLAPDLGRTLEDKETAYLSRARGALFLLTPGCERKGLSFPSPSVNVELGWMKALFAQAPGRVTYLLDSRCTLPAIDQKARIEFNAADHRSVVRAIAQLARNLGAAVAKRSDEGEGVRKPSLLERWLALGSDDRTVLHGLVAQPHGSVIAYDLHDKFRQGLKLTTERMNFAVTRLRAAGLSETRASRPPANLAWEGATALGTLVAQAGQEHMLALRTDTSYAKRWDADQAARAKKSAEGPG